MIYKKPNYDKMRKNVQYRINRAMETSANSTLKLMKTRIKRGVNHKGGKFKSLSKDYQDYKKDQGKLQMFEFSGDMLRSLKTKVKKTKDSARIIMDFDDSNENEKAYQNIYTHKRDFMQVSDKEIDRIVRKIEKELLHI